MLEVKVTSCIPSEESAAKTRFSDILALLALLLLPLAERTQNANYKAWIRPVYTAATLAVQPPLLSQSRRHKVAIYHSIHLSTIQGLAYTSYTLIYLYKKVAKTSLKRCSKGMRGLDW
jgi:hypothetical protein